MKNGFFLCAKWTSRFFIVVILCVGGPCVLCPILAAHKIEPSLLNIVWWLAMFAFAVWAGKNSRYIPPGEKEEAEPLRPAWYDPIIYHPLFDLVYYPGPARTVFYVAGGFCVMYGIGLLFASLPD
jgi:hypothetical protein